ncbi:MAG TPA: NAD(P)/FAD-dependent oxidoreductase [Chloroflexota bacterium]|nr:NAD(P)/FAD-dependent oxidoreductase [Chloroflexota bacterium]
MQPTTPHVVIVGGGFGGINAAKAFAKQPVRVTLIDRRNHHLFQPLLYQVATAALSPGQIAAPIRAIFRRQPNVEVLLAEVTGFDLEGRHVLTADGGAIDYDYLIVAPGARDNYFGHDEWRTVAPGLKSLDEALDIRRRILRAYETAEREALAARADGRELSRERLDELLTFVIVGGGPTGVEMAGAIAEIARHTLRGEFRYVDPSRTRIVLVEGSPQLLNGYPAKLSNEATARLHRLGVEVRTATLVTDVREGEVRIGEERIPAGTIIWAAGVRASELGARLGVPLDRSGRVPVEPDLTVPGHPEVYVVGDLAAVPGKDGRPLPGVAQPAIQGGKWAAQNVLRTIRGEPRKPFRYVDLGRMAIIGRGAGVAEIGPLKLGGFVAWLMWLFIHIAYLIGFQNRLLVLTQWAWSYVTYQRAARLITGDRSAIERVRV